MNALFKCGKKDRYGHPEIFTKDDERSKLILAFGST
jgi:hypothetical protein